MHAFFCQDKGRKMAGEMKAIFLETCAKDNQCASDIFIKSLMQIEKVSYNLYFATTLMLDKQVLR